MEWCQVCEVGTDDGDGHATYCRECEVDIFADSAWWLRADGGVGGDPHLCDECAKKPLPPAGGPK